MQSMTSPSAPRDALTSNQTNPTLPNSSFESLCQCDPSTPRTQTTEETEETENVNKIPRSTKFLDSEQCFPRDRTVTCKYETESKQESLRGGCYRPERAAMN